MSGFDDSIFQFGEGGQMPRRDDGVWPEFYVKAEQNPRKSAEAGRPIFDEHEYVYIRLVGDKGTVFSTKVRDEHRQRWPREYQAWKTKTELSSTGTPLEQWPLLSVGTVQEMKALSIRSVEDLAGLSDAGIQRLGPGGRKWVEMAKAYLDQAEDGSAIPRLELELERLRMQVDALQRQNAELRAQLDATGEDERGPRRPRKEAA